MTRDRHQEGRDAADTEVGRTNLHGAWDSFYRCAAYPKDAYDKGFQQRLLELEKESKIKVSASLSHVNWELLRKQKQALLEAIDSLRGADMDEFLLLQGILHLIDHIQDEAAEQLGEETVFGKLGG